MRYAPNTSLHNQALTKGALEHCSTMSTDLAPYFITAAATLSGVAITGTLAEFRERRRAREDRQRELDRLTEERLKWLRTERRQSYAAFLDIGYQAANMLIEVASRILDGENLEGAAELMVPLDALRDAIRVRVADIELVGSPDVVSAALDVRRAFRRAPNIAATAIAQLSTTDADREGLSAALSSKVREMYTVVQNFVDSAQADLAIHNSTNATAAESNRT